MNSNTLAALEQFTKIVEFHLTEMAGKVYDQPQEARNEIAGAAEDLRDAIREEGRA